MSKRTLVIGMVAVLVLVLTFWAFLYINKTHYSEQIANFGIPFGTQTDSNSDSTRFGAEGWRLEVYELDPAYGTGLYRSCTSLGYSQLTRQQADAMFPSLGPYFPSSDSVCVRRKDEDSLAFSLLQNNRLIIYVIY